MTYRAVHEPCGGEVRTELPPEYPVDEGVGLWCPRCDESWWDTSGELRPHPTSPATTDASRAPSPAELRPHPTSPATTDASRAPKPERPGHGRRSVVPAAAVLVLIAAVAGITAATNDSGSLETAAAPTATATATPEPTPTPEPTIAPAAATLAGRTVEFTTAPGWEPLADRVGTALTGSEGAARVSVSAAPLRGRSLARLGTDAARGLRATLPRHRLGAVTPVDLNGRRALRVTARRGEDARELTVLAAGDQRFLVVLELAPGTPPEARRAARAIADSVTIR